MDVVCNELMLAKHCAACLPNVEDEFFKLKGKNYAISSISHSNKKISFKDKIKKYIDFLGGVKLINQQGHLPMLSSKNVKTWLVISNDKPSLIDVPITAFELELIIFNEEGNKIKKINQVIDKFKNYKICLNEFVPPPSAALETFYVKLKRFPKHKGFRGSSRPHFFYETSNSMSALHIQDGDKRQNFINFPVSQNNDKNILFFINPSEKNATITSRIINNST